MLIKNVRLLAELSGGYKAAYGSVRVKDGRITEVSAEELLQIPQ